MKIGVWLDKDYKPEEGGGFSYYDRLIKAIDKYSFSKEVEICFVTEGIVENKFEKSIITLEFNNYNPQKSFKQKIFEKIPIVKLLFKYKWDKYIRLNDKKQKLEKENNYYRILKESEIKILYFPKQAPSIVLLDFPFIATNWDIGHCSTYAFPELIINGEYDNRNFYYTNILPRALMVFTESNAGKNELLQFTKLNESKIRVVPIFAGNSISVKVTEKMQESLLYKYSLIKNNFFFYPAQFWAHKNHNGLLQAFSMFTKENPQYKLVLTGSDHGNLNYIKSICDKLNLNNNVLFLGFVSVEEIYTFYKNSTALVMATYFGPTNMPPIEAMELGCPVICSDILGHKEILGEAAIYFDPNSHESIFNAMLDLLECRDSIKIKMQIRKLTSVFTIDFALKTIDINLKEVIRIRSNWE